MSDNHTTSGKSTGFLIPIIFLAIIAILSLYIVRDNFQERVSNEPEREVNKNIRSDHERFLIEGNATETSTNSKIDSTHRERGSQPELDNAK